VAIEIDMKVFNELLQIQKERKLAMDELSLALGYDVSFSEEEVKQFAMEEYEKLISKKIDEEVQKWMKSLYS
jgi:F0F1-type ATP synthase membrane subunit b/b'|tara:strand:+ start:1691 stop:1906 length:216 start_codon:yes stop_codon:yes gene_type:complete